MCNWLELKIAKANPNNPKSHTGLVTMQGHPDYIEKLPTCLYLALQLMTDRFASHSISNPHGSTKLTELSVAIGKIAIQYFRTDATTAPSHLAVGDVILGAFNYGEFIHIGLEEGYSLFSPQTPYIVTATEKYVELADIPPQHTKDLILGSTEVPISTLSNIIQGNNRSVIKNYSEEHITDLAEAISEDAPWIQGINKMQATGWQINKDVYHVVNRDFQGMKRIPPKRPFLGTKKSVDDAFDALKALDTPSNRGRYNQAVKLWNKELEVLKIISKNMELDVTRAKAEYLKDLGTFYQYVECDYRGRAYYYEPTMNYQGPDIARGLMQFEEGVVLTRSGLKWLAIHTACSYNQVYEIDEIPTWANPVYKTILEEQQLESISVDKMTLEDREKWTWENLDMILDSRDTLVSCEKSVVFLACCLEWFKYIADPEGHLSHLPVPIDGSCNGYQHSAAISRDATTGALVSMTEQEVPADLYVTAAQELNRRNPSFFSARPAMKMKHIRKGIAKRAVMTRAYSAGKDKISESMYQDCHTEGYTDAFNIDMLDCQTLGSEMYELIKDVCPGATRTMKFLQALAVFQLGSFDTYDNTGKKISKTKKKKLHARKQVLKKIKEPTTEDLTELNDISKTLDSYEVRCTRGNGSRHLDWHTPSGFHVIYESFLEKDWKVRSTIPGFSGGESAQNGRIRHVLKEKTNFPDVQGYQAGISPNWIHGEDSAHMMCILAGWDKAFAGVHDSFSTHASYVEELSDLTKEVFIQMYNIENPYQDIVDRLLVGPKEYDGNLPDLGTLDIEDVRKSAYFFC